MVAHYLLTPDEFFSLLQVLVMVLGFIVLVLIFVYLAYEKPTPTAT